MLDLGEEGDIVICFKCVSSRYWKYDAFVLGDGTKIMVIWILFCNFAA